MKNYKMNFTTKTLTITKEFAEMAMIPDSDEAKILKHLKSIVPGLTISYRTHKSPKKANPAKGLTYKKMENYIKLYKNADELLARFEMIKGASKIQTNPYKFVYDWFVTQFPSYKDLPNFVDGKLYAKPLDVTAMIEFDTAA